MTLEEKHLQILDDKLEAGEIPNCIIGKEDASKECAKITLQHCIEVLNEIGNPSSFNKETTYGYLKMKLLDLQKQLSDLNK